MNKLLDEITVDWKKVQWGDTNQEWEEELSKWGRVFFSRLWRLLREETQKEETK